MTEIVFDLLEIYIFSFLTGVGLYRLLAPSFLKQRSFGALLVPALGLLQLTIVSAYLIYLSAPIADSLYASAVVGALTLAVSILLDPRPRQFDFAEAARQFLKRARQNWIASSLKTGLFLLLLGLVMAPVIHAGIATTPYRLGIDQVGYAETAQYLVEGGSLKKISAMLLKRLNVNDITKAKAQNLRALNFQTYVDSEFLLKASRWGFPGSVAALTLLTGSVHVYRIEFLLDILSYAFILGLAFRILRDFFSLPGTVSFAGMAALALNCNVLNVYYEGQLTQVFVLPYFIMGLVLYLQVRLSTRGTNKSLPISSLAKSAVLFMVIVALMFSAYNESVVLLIGFIAVTSVLDLFFFGRLHGRSLIYAGLGLAGGFIAVLPFSNQWLLYTFANLRALPTAGFWQAHWASFAEILGLLNMYQLPHVPESAGIGVGYILVGRSFSNEAINLVLSVALLAILAAFLRAARNLDKNFWIAPFVVILGAYIELRFVDHILNYSYMKVYTMLTPLLVCVMVAAVYNLTQDKTALAILGGGKFGRSLARYAQYAALLAVAVTGLLYIDQYVIQGGYVTTDMFSMYKYSNGSRRFDNVALLTPRRQPSIADFMLVPLISMNLVNQNAGEKYIAPYLQARVAVIFRNDDLHCRQCLVRVFHQKIAYANNSYVVLNTGLQLKDICTKNAKRYTLDTLDIDNRGDWPNLPSPQCDYGVGLKYLSYAR